MKTIPVQSLQAGKYFNRQVFLDEKYILLSPETPLKQSLIKRLSQWGFKNVQTEGDLVENSIPYNPEEEGTENQVTSLEADIKEKEYMEEARHFFNQLLEFNEKVFTNFVTKNELNIALINDKIKSLIEFVKNRKKYILRLTEISSVERNYIVTHSVKTTVLCIAIGITLKFPPHKLIELGISSILHEIGMIRLPPQIYMSEQRLDDQQKKTITAHPVLGFKILKSYSFPMSVCLAVLESHENIDGSGYPRGLTGEKISIYAKIINVCSAYSALISKRPFRDEIDGHAGILDLLSMRGKTYDERVLRALVLNLSIFPIGTYVLLSNGSKGMVIETDKENPRAPVVRLLKGSNGDILQEYPAVRTNNPDYKILRPLAKQEVEEIKAGQ